MSARDDTVVAARQNNPPSAYARSWHNAMRFTKRQPLGAFSFAVLLLLVFTAVFADLVAPYDPLQNRTGPSVSGPSADHLLGTDQFGRDVLSRVIHGGRTSLYVGLGATLIAAVLATVLGAASGYLGGTFDYSLQRLVDAVQAVPPLILLIGVMVVLGPSTLNVVLALGLRSSLSLSRVVRGSVIDIRDAQYVEAARAIGATHLRTLARHVIPNIFPVVIVLISTTIGGLIVAEASLSFLGYGIPPPAPSWGGMMSADGRTYMLVAPWLLIAPMIALSLVVFAMNMLGDALRDELDPRMRGS
jgi:peptide/nickel transport system permease protein